VGGQRGDYAVTLKLSPRYVNTNCTACGDCATAVEAEIDNPYEYGPAKPGRPACRTRCPTDAICARPSIIGTADGEKAQSACKYGAIELDMQDMCARHTGKSVNRRSTGFEREITCCGGVLAFFDP